MERQNGSDDITEASLVSCRRRPDQQAGYQSPSAISSSPVIYRSFLTLTPPIPHPSREWNTVSTHNITFLVLVRKTSCVKYECSAASDDKTLVLSPLSDTVSSGHALHGTLIPPILKS